MVVKYLIAGYKIDLLPLTKKAIKLLEPELPIKPKVLAKIVVANFSAASIPKDKIPENVDPVIFRKVASRIRRWAFNTQKQKQSVDPDIIKMRPFLQFTSDDPNCCARAKELNGKFIKRKAPPLLPLDTCIQDRCLCRLVTHSIRDLERLGITPKSIKITRIGKGFWAFFSKD